MFILINKWKQACRLAEGCHKLFFIGLRAAGILVPMQVALAQINISTFTPSIKRAC